MIKTDNAQKDTAGQTRQAFYRMVFILVLPIMAQNLIDALVTSADVVMLGFVSQQALSAVSLAGNIQFVLSLFLYGMATGASMLASQYWGKGNVRAIEKVLGIALRFSLPFALIFTLLALFAPNLLMRVFTPDIQLIEEGTVYLRVVAFTYLLSGFTVMYLNIMRSMENVRLSAVVYLISFLLNVALNAVFIFVFHMGAKGVAIATLSARAAESLICLFHSACHKKFHIRISDIFSKSGALLRDFLRYAFPAIGNDIAFGVGFTMYSVIIGHLSSDAVAAYSIVTIARKLGTVMCFGMSSGTSILVGKSLGADAMDEASLYAKRMLRLAIYTALLGGGIILALIPVLMRIADLTGAARDYLRVMLFINAYYVLGQAVNTTLICGVFRAGGDSKFGLLCDTITLWGVIIPLSALCAFVFKLPVMWVYFIMCLDEFVKMPFVVHHYRKRGWLNNITREGVVS